MTMIDYIIIGLFVFSIASFIGMIVFLVKILYDIRQIYENKKRLDKKFDDYYDRQRKWAETLDKDGIK